ncbi:hypothetical protein HOH45_02975 [bacterium]|nr:hypothetical protein [bacterium]
MSNNYIDINHLNEASKKYQRVFEKTNLVKADPFGLIKDVFNSLNKSIESIVISNYSSSFHVQRYYTLKITTHEMELVEKNETVKNIINCNLDTKEITLNQQKMPVFFYKSFSLRIKKIFNDIKSLKALVYEEHRER